MGLQVMKQSETQYNPVFLKILEDLIGGVTISTTRIPTTTKFLYPGTPLAESASSLGLFNVVKTAKVKSKAATAISTITLNVYSSSLPNSPGHNFKVGEYVMCEGLGTARVIASITVGTKTNGVGTDIIITTGKLPLVATGTIIEEAVTAATTAAAVKFSASCLLRESVRVRLESGYTLQNVFAGAVVRGTVDESILPCTMDTEAVKTPLTARIRFA